MIISKKIKHCIRKTALPVMLVLLASVSARADEVFAGLAEMNSVESTYVSGRFSHNQRYWVSKDGRHSMNLSQGFSALYIYQCYSEEAVKAARKILDGYLKKNPEMEVVMRTREASSEYLVLEKFMTDNKVSQMIIWSSDAPNVCEIVVVDWKNGLSRGESSYSDTFNPSPNFPMCLDMEIFTPGQLKSLESLLPK